MSTPEQDSWVERVLGERMSDGAEWRSARAAAISSIRSLLAAIKGSGQPNSDRAEMLLRAIAANLTAAPRTASARDDLIYYLSTDDIIEAAETANIFGVKIVLRSPLLAALRKLLVSQ